MKMQNLKVQVQMDSSDIHSVPSYKERSYKERLVDRLGSKERRLDESQRVKER